MSLKPPLAQAQAGGSSTAVSLGGIYPLLDPGGGALKRVVRVHILACHIIAVTRSDYVTTRLRLTETTPCPHRRHGWTFSTPFGLHYVYDTGLPVPSELGD